MLLLWVGDHNIYQVGRFMYDVKEKLPGNDQPVIIEDEVWIGTGVIILKEVIIGRRQCRGRRRIGDSGRTCI